MATHRDKIVDQFTQQAVPFATAPSIRDEGALRQLVAASEVTSRETALDVACGPGLVVRAFAAAAGHVTGIDVTPAMIARAREEVAGLTNVVLDLGDVTALPYRDGQFDVVWKTDGLVPGDAWSDFLPGSKDIEADWVTLKCGNYNTKTKKCSGQNYE